MILIDELGRGTSVEEGVALATSVLQYLHSYGLFIARMAGMPEVVMREAERLMREKKEEKGRVEAYVEKLDVNAMTPVQALVCLNEVKEMVTSK